MKLFNLDLHISVIADLKQVFQQIGHEIDSWCLSGHNWVFDRPAPKVDVINEDTWKSIDPTMCDAFYERYKDELAKYDGFLVTYPPTFAWAFAKWRKPIIIVAPIRYEAPLWGKPFHWQWFNQFVRERVAAGTMALVANSVYDAKYAEWFTGLKWRHIPSVCDYTGVHWAKPKKREFILHSRQPMEIQGTIHKTKALPGRYQWADLTRFSGAVFWPYNASTMTIFETYAQGMPMLFPSHKYATECRRQSQDSIFAELSWNQILGLPPRSSLRTGLENDPNRYNHPEITMEWAILSDFYGQYMPYLRYFDSVDEVPDLLNEWNLDLTSEMMTFVHQRQRGLVCEAWLDVFKGLR